jgi:hypothetical protein
VINKYTFNPPLIKRAGDVFKINGKNLEQWRGIVLVRSAPLVQPEELTSVATVGGETISSLYLEVSMPGQNVSMTSISENQSTGVIIAKFSSGTNIEIPDWESVGLTADSLDSMSDLAEKILLGKAYRASPDGTNKTTQVGASVSVNLLADTPIVYTGPQ